MHEFEKFFQSNFSLPFIGALNEPIYYYTDEFTDGNVDRIIEHVLPNENNDLAIINYTEAYINATEDTFLNNTTGSWNFTDDSFKEGPVNNWWALVALVLVVCTAAGNVLVCLAIYLERRLQNVTNYFLMSLAITDLLVAILVMPLGILTLMRGEFVFIIIRYSS